MGKIFVKQLGTCLIDNEENKELLTSLGLKDNDTKNFKEPNKLASVNIKRVGKSRKSK
jgi:hypothetical protein